MIVIEGLKDGPVEGKATVLILYGNGSVHEECGENLYVKVGKWKALDTTEEISGNQGKFSPVSEAGG